MPQASESLRHLIKLMFGDGIDSEKPIKFLEDAGYSLTQDYHWILPTKEHYPSEEEELCLRFLVDEWDFGWIVEEKHFELGNSTE